MGKKYVESAKLVDKSKQYDSEEAAGFINGIMGSFVEKEVKA